MVKSMHVRIARLLVPRCSAAPSGEAPRTVAQTAKHIFLRSPEGRRPGGTGRGAVLMALAVVCCVLLSACSHTAAAPKVTPTVNASPTATPIPPVLAAYAQAVQPLMRMSASEAAALESKMKHDSLSVVGDECSTFGGAFESAQVTIRGTYTPPAAQVVYHHANGGYRLLAVSTDECGLASDTTSKAEMRAAISDLRSGMSQLKYAFGLTKRWVPGS